MIWAAHSAAEKFIRLHPRHPNIDYAYFMRGLASYTRDNSFLQEFLREVLLEGISQEQNNLSMNYQNF